MRRLQPENPLLYKLRVLQIKKMASESIGVTGNGTVALSYATFFTEIFNLPPGMTCDGHCRLGTDKLFSKSAAETIHAGRKFQLEMEQARFRAMGMRYSRSQLEKMHCMVPLKTDLFANLVLEDVSDAIPERVLTFYDNLFERSGIKDMPREMRMELFNMLRTMPGCCVPAALLGSKLLGEPLTLCRLGFRDPRQANVYDWEYGEHGVRWL